MAFIPNSFLVPLFEFSVQPQVWLLLPVQVTLISFECKTKFGSLRTKDRKRLKLHQSMHCEKKDSWCIDKKTRGALTKKYPHIKLNSIQCRPPNGSEPVVLFAEESSEASNRKLYRWIRTARQQQ